jgi:hypothetical protein
VGFMISIVVGAARTDLFAGHSVLASIKGIHGWCVAGNGWLPRLQTCCHTWKSITHHYSLKSSSCPCRTTPLRRRLLLGETSRKRDEQRRGITSVTTPRYTATPCILRSYLCQITDQMMLSFCNSKVITI